jgi:hypothetical protein
MSTIKEFSLVVVSVSVLELPEALSTLSLSPITSVVMSEPVTDILPPTKLSELLKLKITVCALLAGLAI